MKLKIQLFTKIISNIIVSMIKGKATAPPTKKEQKAPIHLPKEWKAQDYVSDKVKIEEVREVKTAFDIFDLDGSGYVDPVELKNAFVSLGFATSNKFIVNILHGLNVEHSNGMDFAAFLHLATGTLGQTHTRKQIYAVFNSFDHKKHGKINAQQFKEIANELGQHLTDEEIEKIFLKTDLDGDGYLTNQDFYHVMTNKSTWQ